MNEVLLEEIEIAFGGSDILALVVHYLGETSMLGLSASVTFYNSSGASVYGPNSMTVILSSGNRRAEVLQTFTTGVGGNLDAVGDYTAVVTLSLGSIDRVYHVPIRVIASP